MEGDWRTFTEAEFIQDYRERFSSRALTEQDLSERYQQGKRLNHDTLRLIEPGRNTPDVVAQHQGEAERITIGGGGVAPISDDAKARLDPLLAEREAARLQRNEAEDERTVKAQQQKMVRASERLGELAGTEWVHQKYPGPPPPKAIYPPDGQQTSPADSASQGQAPGSGVFDQIFQCTVVRDGRPHTICVINEAKGGSSQLGSRMTKDGIRAGQGTPEYFEDILQSMERKGGDTAHAAATVRSAVADPAQVVKYLHIRAKVVEVQRDTGTDSTAQRNPTSTIGGPSPSPAVSATETEISTRSSANSTAATDSEVSPKAPNQALNISGQEFFSIGDGKSDGEAQSPVRGLLRDEPAADKARTPPNEAPETDQQSAGAVRGGESVDEGDKSAEHTDVPGENGDRIVRSSAEFHEPVDHSAEDHRADELEADKTKSRSGPRPEPLGSETNPVRAEIDPDSVDAESNPVAKDFEKPGIDTSAEPEPDGTASGSPMPPSQPRQPTEANKPDPPNLPEQPDDDAPVSEARSPNEPSPPDQPGPPEPNTVKRTPPAEHGPATRAGEPPSMSPPDRFMRQMESDSAEPPDDRDTDVTQRDRREPDNHDHGAEW